jgi:hypothetical protein
MVMGYKFNAFGGRANCPDFDNTPVFVRAMEVCHENQIFDLHFGVGTYSFHTPIPEINSAMRLHGVSQYHTRLQREYVEPDSSRGFLQFREIGDTDNRYDPTKTIRGSALKDLVISSGANSTGGTMIVLTTDKEVTGWFLIEGVRISHLNLGGSYRRALQVDGRKNVKPGGQGFRDLYARNLFIWAPPDFPPGRAIAAFLNCNSLEAHMWTNSIVLVGGDSDPLTKTTNGLLYIHGGDLLVQNSARLSSFGSLANLTHSIGAVRCRHYGSVVTYLNASGDQSNTWV